jgi:serine/threonine protein phosphatase PrpC
MASINNSVFQVPKIASKYLEFDDGYTLKYGSNTDIGGNLYNQDAFCVIHFKSDLLNKSGSAFCIADGHGKEGELAAKVSTNRLEELIKEGVDEFVEDPVAFLDLAFKNIHEEIKTKLIEKLTEDGQEVVINDGGDVTARRFTSHNFNVVKCGTTFSVIVFLDKKLYIANVGDSTGILYSEKPVFTPFRIEDEKSNSSNPVISDPERDILNENGCNKAATSANYIEMTGDHSPENPLEYIRMRDFKCCGDNPLLAELKCIYDNQCEQNKYNCPDVFNISETGEPIVRPVDSSFTFYNKNVRGEKATYVTDRHGINALSATRALGDFGLNSQGVSCNAEIRTIDLQEIFTQIKEEPILCFVLCSDGVWDNWIYDHVGKFVFDKSCLNAIEKDKENGAQRVTNSFMLRNQMFAKKNFGSNSDNSTGIIVYIEKR